MTHSPEQLLEKISKDPEFAKWADDLVHLKKMLDSGSITATEFQELVNDIKDNVIVEKLADDLEQRSSMIKCLDGLISLAKNFPK